MPNPYHGKRVITERRRTKRQTRQPLEDQNNRRRSKTPYKDRKMGKVYSYFHFVSFLFLELPSWRVNMVWLIYHQDHYPALISLLSLCFYYLSSSNEFIKILVFFFQFFSHGIDLATIVCNSSYISEQIVYCNQ